MLYLIVYTGTGTDTEIDKEFGYSGSVVKKLLEPHLDKGHNLYVEGLYTSPKLFHYLYSKKNRSMWDCETRQKVNSCTTRCETWLMFHTTKTICYV